eukprot:9586245-Heterocapsa_arctica.AAC.1
MMSRGTKAGDFWVSLAPSWSLSSTSARAFRQSGDALSRNGCGTAPACSRNPHAAATCPGR